MKHNIHDDVWKTMAGEIQLYWKDLTEKEVGKARRGEEALRKIIKERYQLTSAQADEQVDAFITAYTLNTLEIRDTPRI
ncbi:MAG TPA: hypothetical protein VF050_10595 [Moraxellaceae bacterium]